MSLPGSGKVFSTGPILQLPPGTAISSLPVEQRALYLDPHQDPDDPQLLRTDFSPTIIENSLPPIQLLMSQFMLLKLSRLTLPTWLPLPLPTWLPLLRLTLPTLPLLRLTLPTWLSLPLSRVTLA